MPHGGPQPRTRKGSFLRGRLFFYAKLCNRHGYARSTMPPPDASRSPPLVEKNAPLPTWAMTSHGTAQKMNHEKPPSCPYNDHVYTTIWLTVLRSPEPPLSCAIEITKPLPCMTGVNCSVVSKDTYYIYRSVNYDSPHSSPRSFSTVIHL